LLLNSTWNYITSKTRVPLEVLQKKCEVDLQLHLFLGAEFVELKVFGNAELEQSSPKHPPYTAILAVFPCQTRIYIYAY
jgi:hypothetical protein